MPELPEIETLRRGLAPQLTGRVIRAAHIYNANLRWKIPPKISTLVKNATIKRVSRRAKYLMFNLDTGTLIFHLGMSGSLRIFDNGTARAKHDHFELQFQDNQLLRFNDARRFGAILWTDHNPESHPLLAKLGLEPLSRQCNAKWFYQQLLKRNTSIKQLLMNGHVIAGIGNIYANESLFLAGIRPQTSAKDLDFESSRKLVKALRHTLRLAIKAGGSSIRDFVDSAGKAGYFQQHYAVYGRTGEACLRCGGAIKLMRQGQRSSFYCARCQA